MATNGDLLINSEEISSIVSVVNTIASTLESDMATSVSTNFTGLVDAGLFADGISNLSQVISALAASYSNLASMISTHSDDMAETEDKLAQSAQNNRNSYGTRGSGSSGGGSSGGSGGGSGTNIPDDGVPDVSDGTAINTDDLLNKIDEITDDSYAKLVNFLNINKNKNISINELLFDNDNSIKLVNLLRQYYGDTTSNTMFSLDDATLIQKALIAKMFEAKTLPQNLTDNTILVAKNYLNSIAKENNIAIEDLLLDDENTLILATSLMDVYDGNGIAQYDVSKEEIEAIRDYMDGVAEANDTTVEDLASDPDKFL